MAPLHLTLFLMSFGASARVIARQLRVHATDMDWPALLFVAITIAPIAKTLK